MHDTIVEKFDQIIKQVDQFSNIFFFSKTHEGLRKIPNNIIKL